MKPIRKYCVTMIFATPAYGEKSEEKVAQWATNPSDAIRFARRDLRNNGFTRWDGKVTFRARLARPDDNFPTEEDIEECI